METPAESAPVAGASEEKEPGTSVGAEPSVASPKTQVGMDGHQYPIMSTFQATALILTSATMVINILQTQVVIIGIEKIGTDLNIPLPSYQWLASAYSLSFGALLLLFGRLADIYGHKLVHLLGMAWFCVWSIATGFAQNEISIDLFRAMQGAGLGAAIPAALGILGSSFPPSQLKSTAFATFSAGAPIGGSLGAVFGGILTEYAPAGWRSAFYLSAGLGALIAISCWFSVPPDGPVLEVNRTVDWTGGALITIGLVLLTFALADGSSVIKGWRTPYIPALFSVSIIVLVAFWFWEHHVEYRTQNIPLMRTSLWFKGRFALVQLVAALGWSSFSSFMFFTTLYYQTYQLLSPIDTTIRFLASPVTGVILNVVVAVVASRIPANYLIILGCLGTGLAPLLFAVQDTSAPYWQYNFPGMILAVFGADFIFSCGIMYVSKVAGPGQQALAGGVFSMTTQVGTSVGLAIMTIIQSKVTESEVTRLGGVYNPLSADVPLEAVLKALRMAFWGCTAFAFAAGLIAVAGLNGIGTVGHRIKKLAPGAVAAQEEGGKGNLEV